MNDNEIEGQEVFMVLPLSDQAVLGEIELHLAFESAVRATLAAWAECLDESPE